MPNNAGLRPAFRVSRGDGILSTLHNSLTIGSAPAGNTSEVGLARRAHLDSAIKANFSIIIRTIPRTGPLGLLLVTASAMLGGCSHNPPPAPVVTTHAPSSSVRYTRQDSHVSSPASASDISSGNMAILSFTDPLSSSVLIDKVIARHRRSQEASLASQPWVKSSAANAAKRGRSRKGLGETADQESLTAAYGVPAVDPCAETSTRRKTKSRQPLKRPDCMVARQNLVGPPDPRTMPKGWVKRGDDWDRVRNGLVLARIQHERLEAHLAYLRERPGNVDFLMTQAEPYLQYLLGEIRRQGLPTDLIVVPMVESAFRTTALSPKQAAGLWQFIPSTGQQYGLQLSENYDGRYDTHPATLAALKYLKHLHGLFKGDWLLAFAAYNAGEGAVQRAIQANLMAGGAGSFWELDLPQETQNYVVKILALSKVVADPASHGFKPRKAVVSRTTLARVEAKPEVHISDLIASSGIAPDEFYKLNPAFKPDVEPQPQPHNFLLPLEKAEILMAANLHGAKVFAPRKIVVQKGDTLTLLARKHGVPEMKLAEWNGLPPRASLKVGQEILVQGV